MATINKITLPDGSSYDIKDNTSGYITDAGVTSFNGSTGAVTYTAPVTSVNGQTGAVTISTDNGKVFYGTCSTEASTGTKVVTCSEFTENNLVKGTVIRVQFSYANSTMGPTLNVNNTGAKNITISGALVLSSYRYTSLWRADERCTFIYSGSSWEIVGKDDATTSYYGVTKLEDSISSTSTTTAATSNAVKQVNDKVEERVFYSIDESSDHYNVTSSSVFDYHPSGDDPTLGLNIQSESADGTDTVDYSLQWTPDTLRLRDNDSDTNLWEFKPNKIVPSSTTPIMDGTAAVGTETSYARGDHVHPHDTAKANLASPTFTGTPKAPTATAGTNTTQIATTAFVTTAVSALKNEVTVKTIASASRASGSDVTIGNTGSLAAGTYAIAYRVWWASNTTGRRSCYLATTTSGSEWNSTRITIAPASGDTTCIRGYVLCTLTSATTLYLRAYHNVGSAINVGGQLEILKLH